MKTRSRILALDSHAVLGHHKHDQQHGTDGTGGTSCGKRALEVYLWMIILIPRSHAFYLPDVLLVAMFAGTVLWRFTTGLNDRHFGSARGFLAIACIFALSCLYNEMFTLGRQDTALMMKEGLRVAKYGMLIAVGARYGTSHRLDRLVRAISAAAIVAVGVAVCQIWRIPYIGPFVRGLYPSLLAASYNACTEGNWRASSTFGNPNVFGAFLVIPLAMELNALLTGVPHRGTIKGGARLCVYVAGVLLSQSRTSLLASAVAVGYVSLTMVRRSSRNTKRLRVVFRSLAFAFAAGLLLVMGIRYLNASRMGDFIGSMGHGAVLKAGSVTYRVQVAKETLSAVLYHNPILGFGIGSLPPEALDSDYLYWMYYSGLLGLLTYCLLIWRWKRQLSEHKGAAVGLMAALMGLLVGGLTQGLFFSERLFSTLVSLVGANLGSRYMPTITEQFDHPDLANGHNGLPGTRS